MIRRAAAVTVGVMAWLALVASPAGAQADAPPAAGTPQHGDGRRRPRPATSSPGGDRGVLVRPDRAIGRADAGGLPRLVGRGPHPRPASPSGAGLLAVQAAELATGVVVGRRGPGRVLGPRRPPTALAGGSGAAADSRPALDPAVPMLVGSGDTVSIAGARATGPGGVRKGSPRWLNATCTNLVRRSPGAS